MIKHIISCLIMVYTTFVAYAENHTVVNIGSTFSPPELTINTGDTVTWDLENVHNVVEVSQATYNANGNTSNGGFSLPFGGGFHTFSVPGTYYYVCGPHAEFGMKGTITVSTISGSSNAIQSNRIGATYKPGVLFVRQSGIRSGQPTRITVYSVTGQQIAGAQVAAGDGMIQMQGVTLMAGIYLVKVNVNNKTTVVKVNVN